MTDLDAHGGPLVDLMVDDATAEVLEAEAAGMRSITLTRRQRCDLELLLCGGFSPLTGYLGRADYEAVRDHCRLANGTVWPMPITLDVDEQWAAGLEPRDRLALLGRTGELLAVLTVDDVYEPDQDLEAHAVFGTDEDGHAGVAHLQQSHTVYIGGTVQGIRMPPHDEFTELRRTPRQLRAEFDRRCWDRVVAFNTRNPMHRAHQELTLRATDELDAHLLIHPIVGITRPGDVDYHTRIACYQALLPRYPTDRVMLSLLPLAMRMGGPREALWHALIRRNFGLTHFIIGRDHAGPGDDRSGEPFYGTYEAQELVARYADELGIGVWPSKVIVYVAEHDRYEPADEVPEGATTLSISGTELRRRLHGGEDIPEWITYPEIVEILRHSYRHPDHDPTE